MQNTLKHFFISYNQADRQWAEWIAWQLEGEGYTTILQAWDFLPGTNFVKQMDRAVQSAERTIAVLSPNYLNALYTHSEWQAAFKQDPTGEKGILIPVRVQECKPSGLLGTISYIDLVGQEDQAKAREILLTGVLRRRAKPMSPPAFPKGSRRATIQEPIFPGTMSLPALRNYNAPQQHLYVPPPISHGVPEKVYEKKKSRVVWVVPVVIICLLLAGCVTAAVLGFSFVSSFLANFTNQPTGTPSTTLTAFCNALQSADYQAAYNQLSSGFQKTFNGELDFANKYSNNDSNGKVTRCQVLNSSQNGPLGGYGTLEVTFENGKRAWDDYHLVGENGVWKIDSMQSRQYIG